MDSQAREARQKRWEARRREIFTERKARREEAEREGFAIASALRDSDLPLQAPDWWEPERRDGEPVNIGRPEILDATYAREGAIPAHVQDSMLGRTAGEVRVPGEAVAALIAERRPAPPRKRSALELIDDFLGRN